MDIFLDYYYPYAGLCNQLYLITNHIHQAYKIGVQIYINKVNIDIFKKNRIPAEEFFDLVKTNENIKQLTGKDIILFEKPQTNFIIPRLCIYPVSSIEILACLEFQERFTKFVPKTSFNGIHFRLELDVIIHYLFDKDCYNDFMGHCNLDTLNTNFLEKFINLPEIKEYIEYLLMQYFNFILQIGFDKPWFISTLITKKSVHDCLIPTLKRVTDFIESSGGTWFISKQNFKERELNALVDLLTLRDSIDFIGFEGSSFSEGYVFKVKKNINKCLFVNGIVPKLDVKLYSDICK